MLSTRIEKNGDADNSRLHRLWDNRGKNTYVDRNRFVAFAPSIGVHTTDEAMTRTYIHMNV